MIREILNSDLDDILRIQESVYSNNYLESSESLNSKTIASPDSCFLFSNNSQIASYCIAYPFPKDEIPELNIPLMSIADSNNIFIHDLSVSPSMSGKGIATKMLQHLFRICSQKAIFSATLVAVQNTVLFWQKFGFKAIEKQPLKPSYGIESKFMYCAKLSNKSLQRKF
jgi:GNAT superfamily N-acetyltransferase